MYVVQIYKRKYFPQSMNSLNIGFLNYLYDVFANKMLKTNA
jgi:hypothetical protein